MSRCAPLASLVMLLPVTSCGSAERSPASDVRDSVGVQIVSSAYLADSTPAAFAVTPTPSTDIGAEADDPAHQLFRVRGAMRLPTGSIVVLDGGSTEVRFFTGQGAHRHTVGGDGQGPGEFRDFAGLAVVGSDSLLVYDPALGRVTVMDTEGALRGSFRLNASGDPVHPLRLYRLGRERIDSHLVLLVNAYPADMQPTPRVHWDSVPNLLFSMAGVLRDTIGEFSGMDTYATPARAGGLLFGRYSHADVHRDELHITDGGDYGYRVYGPRGVRRIVRLRRGRRPLTDEDEAALVATYMGRVDDADRERMARYLAETPRADAKPWVSDLIVDERGNVWLQEYASPWIPGPRTWSVFSPAGAWLGRVALPAGLHVLQIGRDFVLGIWRDEMGVEHVRVYDLPS